MAVTCLHSEVIDSATHIGKCKICGQERFYDPETPGEFLVTKRGSIDGNPTEITPPKKGKRAPAEALETVPETAPPKPSAASKQSKPKYDEHREEMLSDYGQMTITALGKKWNMSRGYFYHWKKKQEAKGISIPTASADRAPEEPSPAYPKKRGHYAKRREPAPASSEHFQTCPLNKRTGVRAIWRF